MQCEEYYRLPREKRWLESGENKYMPHNMGGISVTDISTIAVLINEKVKSYFNEENTPEDINKEVESIQKTLCDAEQFVCESIDSISKIIKKYNGSAIGIGGSLTAPPSHTTGRTGRVSGGSADQAEPGPGRKRPSLSK